MTEQPFHVSVSKLRPATRSRIEAVIRSSVPSVAPALAVSVWQSGAPSFEAYAGWLGPDSETNRAGHSTLFDLASVSKLFTVTAFLRLANDFKVGLDDPVVSIIPEFGASGPRPVDGGQEPLSRRVLPTPVDREGWTVDPDSVTFKQLLTHTSGMAPWRAVFRDAGPVLPPADEPDPVSPAERRDAGLDTICSYPFVARPGEEFRYSDLGFMLLGEAVSRINGTPLDLAMRTLIRDRLGLDSLTYAPVRAGRPKERIAPTSLDDDWRGRRCWGEVEDENAAGLGGVAGHAGLFATAHDVARFGMAWLRRDPRLRLDRMQQTAVTNLTQGMGAARGLGWQVQPTDHLEPFSPTAYGHTGFTGTSIAIDPGRDLVVVLLTNRVYAGRTHKGIEELRTNLHRIVAEAFSMNS